MGMNCSRPDRRTMASYLYLAGSVCFFVGTLINMIGAK